MTEFHSSDEESGVSRRTLVAGGLGAVAGASALIGALPGVSSAAGAVPAVTGARHSDAVQALPRPEVLGATFPALTYLPIDAFDFSSAGVRYTDDSSGTGNTVVSPTAFVAVSLPLPVGSVIRQINISFKGDTTAPTLTIAKRTLETPNPTTAVFTSAPLVIDGMPHTQTLNLDGSTPALAPVTIDAAATYSLRYFTPEPDTSVYGVTIGYVPPTQSFTPFVGTPRVLDTRVTGGPLAAGEERVIDLGAPAFARGAVLNLTVTETENAGGGGFVAVFPANIAWPGNSSINWFGGNQNLANSVTTAIDPTGKIKIRGGVSKTQVVIDRIGWLV